MIIGTIITLLVYIIVCLYVGLYIARDIKNESIKILFWIIYVIICCAMSNFVIMLGLWGELYYKKGRVGPRGPMGDMGDRGNAGNCEDKCQTVECNRAIEDAINNELAKLSKSKLRNKNMFLKTKISQICKSKEYALVVETKGADDFINYLKTIFVEWTRLLWKYGGPQFFQSEIANANYAWKDGYNPITEMEKYDVYHLGMIREFRPARVEVCNDPAKSNYMPERDKPTMAYMTTNYYKYLYNITSNKIPANDTTPTTTESIITFWRTEEYKQNYHTYEKERYFALGDIAIWLPVANISSVVNSVDKKTGPHTFKIPQVSYDYNMFIEFYTGQNYKGNLIDKVHVATNYFDKTNLRMTYSIKIPRSIENRSGDKVIRTPIRSYMVLYGDSKNLGIRTPKILADDPVNRQVSLIHNRSTFDYTIPQMASIKLLYSVIISTGGKRNKENHDKARKLIADNGIRFRPFELATVRGGMGRQSSQQRAYTKMDPATQMATLENLIKEYNYILLNGVPSLEVFNFKRVAKSGDAGKRDGRFGGRVRRFRGWIHNPLPDGGAAMETFLITGDCKIPTDYKLVYSNAAEYNKISDFQDGIPANSRRDAILAAMQYSIWEPVAPRGYIACGHVFQNSYEKPATNHVRCIPATCAIKIEAAEDIDIANIGDIRVKISKRTGLFKFLANGFNGDIYELNVQCAEYKYKDTAKPANKAFTTLGIGWNGSPNRGAAKYSIFKYLQFMPEGIITNSHTGRKYYIISSYSLDVSESEPFDFRKFRAVNLYLVLKYNNGTQAYTDALSVAGNKNIVIAPASNADIRQLWEIIFVDEATGTFRLRSKDTGNYLWHDKQPNLRGRAVEKQSNTTDYKHTLFMNMKAAFGGDYPQIDKPAREYEGRFITDDPYIPM